MGTTTPWVGDAFFARERTPEQIETIQAERFDTATEQVMRELADPAKKRWEREARLAEKEQAHDNAIQLYREWMRLASERYHAVTRVQVDEEAFGLLPVRTAGTIPAEKTDDEIRANARAAARFFTRVDGQNLSREIDGHRRWATMRQRYTPAMIRWATAPVDPLTPEEAATIGLGGIGQRRRHRQATRLYVKGQIRPAAMTLERALEVAHAAFDAIDNGTAPTYQ